MKVRVMARDGHVYEDSLLGKLKPDKDGLAEIPDRTEDFLKLVCGDDFDRFSVIAPVISPVNQDEHFTLFVQDDYD